MKQHTIVVAIIGAAIAIGGLQLLINPAEETKPQPSEREWKPAKVKMGGRNPPKMPAEGLWTKAETRALTEELEALEAIGYMGGTEEDKGEAGVTINDPRAVSGLNFFVSGHEASATLMAMDGTILHEWKRPFHSVWPDKKPDETRPAHQFWRRAHLFPNGDILAIFEGYGLVKMDHESNVIWEWDGGAHHDLEVLPDGRIWVLSREGRKMPSLHKKPIMVDHASLLSADGTELKRINILEAVLRSKARVVYKKRRKKAGDIFHTNSISLLTEERPRHPAFKAGRLLLSMRTVSALMVLDPESEEITWWHQGKYGQQHDPKILSNGHMLLFDNLGPTKKASLVREYDPKDMSQKWVYKGKKEAPFFSRFCGTAERFSNGNTLITESSMGRVLEVTPAGETVWEFKNPQRAGEHNEYVAIIPELLRIPEASIQFPFVEPAEPEPKK